MTGDLLVLSEFLKLCAGHSRLACYLLGIREPEQLRHHPLRGAIFESWVVSELYKAQVNRGEQSQQRSIARLVSW